MQILARFSKAQSRRLQFGLVMNIIQVICMAIVLVLLLKQPGSYGLLMILLCLVALVCGGLSLAVIFGRYRRIIAQAPAIFVEHGNLVYRDFFPVMVPLSDIQGYKFHMPKRKVAPNWVILKMRGGKTKILPLLFVDDLDVLVRFLRSEIAILPA